MEDDTRHAAQEHVEAAADAYYVLGLSLTAWHPQGRRAFRRCLALRRRFMAHPQSLATVLLQVAMGHQATQDVEAALDSLLEASSCVSLAEEEGQIIDPVTAAGIWMVMAQVQRQLGTVEDAEDSFREAARRLWVTRGQLGAELGRLVGQLLQLRGINWDEPASLNAAVDWLAAVVESQPLDWTTATAA